MASMCVGGILWELRFDAEGNHHWEADGVTEEQEAAMVDISWPSHLLLAGILERLLLQIRSHNSSASGFVGKWSEGPVLHHGAAKALKIRQAAHWAATS